MSSNYNNRRPVPPAGTDKPKRHLKTKPVLTIIGVLLLFNILWLIAWLIPNDTGKAEKVASVIGEAITREEWLASMEEQHGREALLELVNEKVMATAAQDYGIEVSDKEIDLELALVRSSRDGTEASLYAVDDTRQREKIKAQLILEKVLTKDVVIEKEEIKAFYDDNESLYDVKDSYRTRIIVLNSSAEAEETIKELEKGSSFEATARERSIDSATGNLGGDIGYISNGEPSVDANIAKAVSKVEVGRWSSPLPLENGKTAIISVTEKVDGQTFSYEDVAGHINRELALEQLPQAVTPEAFWQEFDAEWFYGE